MVEKRLVINKTFLFFMFVNVLAICVVLFNYFMFAHVDLIGKSEVVLNYKEEYIEKGFIATRVGKDISDEVLVTGKANTSKLGKYKITYEVPGLFGKSVVRTIEVKDLEKPVLDVDGSKKIYLCPGTKQWKSIF